LPRPAAFRSSRAASTWVPRPIGKSRRPGKSIPPGGVAAIGHCPSAKTVRFLADLRAEVGVTFKYLKSRLAQDLAGPAVEALIKDDPETLAMWRQAITPDRGRPTEEKNDNVIIKPE
jgi:hypothetical protein